MKIPTIHILLLCLLTFACQQAEKKHTNTLYAERTTSAERKEFREKLDHELIGQALALQPDSANEGVWQGAFWAMGMSHTVSPKIEDGLRKCFSVYNFRSASFRRGLLEAVYTLYPVAFKAEMEQVFSTETNHKLLAMATHYLIRAGTDSMGLLEQLEQRFPDWAMSPMLVCLIEDAIFTKEEKVANRPDLKPLIEFQKTHQLPVVYSFQRTDRKYTGLAIVQRANGTFVRNDEGEIVCFPQLALSASDMPSYITNGNSPQGVYTIAEIGHSENVFIGPSPTLEMYLPFETSVQDFFHQKIQLAGASLVENPEWTLMQYNQLFPESWQGYRPIQQAFWAGKVGRSEIIAHGSTINPTFFAHESFYPMTPSLGCLTALELWSEETGTLLESSQTGLVEAFKEEGGKGYCYVIELDSRKAAVTAEELIDLIE
ncbi:hypothetical protein V6R21_00115 [Limibacter armeniacum]|uniref:hypothetical protein n=1 Tax=Limibacter armeniacum TaxID=466084 RepID=UPI002FE5A085